MNPTFSSSSSSSSSTSAWMVPADLKTKNSGSMNPQPLPHKCGISRFQDQLFIMEIMRNYQFVPFPPEEANARLPTAQELKRKAQFNGKLERLVEEKLEQLMEKRNRKKQKQGMNKWFPPPAGPTEKPVEKQESVSSSSSSQKVENPPPLTTIGKAEWAAPTLIKNLPPYPQELKDFLAADCTIWPGKKRSENHIVVPLFPTLIIDGTPVPRSLGSLEQLDKSSGGHGYWRFLKEMPKDGPAENVFHWGVMTNALLPESRGKSYDAQQALLPPGYEIPGALDAATALLWENQRRGKRSSTDDSWVWWGNYTWCKEIVISSHNKTHDNRPRVFVGGPVDAGLNIGYAPVTPIPKSIGVAGFRKF